MVFVPHVLCLFTSWRMLFSCSFRASRAKLIHLMEDAIFLWFSCLKCYAYSPHGGCYFLVVFVPHVLSLFTSWRMLFSCGFRASRAMLIHLMEDAIFLWFSCLTCYAYSPHGGCYFLVVFVPHVLSLFTSWRMLFSCGFRASRAMLIHLMEDAIFLWFSCLTCYAYSPHGGCYFLVVFVPHVLCLFTSWRMLFSCGFRASSAKLVVAKNLGVTILGQWLASSN